MKKEIIFALYSIKKNIQSSAELRTSFITNIVGMFLNNIAFIIIWVFFVQSVGIINGWTAADVIGLQGFGALSFGIVFSTGSGIRNIADYVASGSFDRFLLSPKNLLLRIATSSFHVSALGDVLFGITCLTFYAILIQANLYQIFLMIVSIILSVIVFLAVGIAVYAMSFLFTDASNITSGLFDFFLSPALFHGGAFQGGMRFFFTFIVPSLLVGGLPVEIIRDMSLDTLLLVAVVSCVWLFLSIKLFGWGVKRYESSNFITFGS